jgi:uncharacterized protein HemX
MATMLEGRAGLIEMLLFFALVMAWAGWQVWDYRKWKREQQRQQQQQETDRRQQRPPPGPPPPAD